jgi:hypothetical protein
MDTSGPRQGPAASSCENTKKYSGHIKRGEFLDQIIDYHLFQNAVIHVIRYSVLSVSPYLDIGNQ